jgi:hypothetical protein
MTFVKLLHRRLNPTVLTLAMLCATMSNSFVRAFKLAPIWAAMSVTSDSSCYTDSPLTTAARVTSPNAGATLRPSPSSCREEISAVM